MAANLSAPATGARTTPHRIAGYPEIGDYAAIGDGRVVALVASDGSIDWLCLPALDSPSVFAAVLDAAQGGRFGLEPAVPYTVSRRYVEDTNVLETDFHTADGVVRVTDALSTDLGQQVPWRELIRRVECLGERAVPMRWRCEPRFGFGARAARFEPHGDAFVARDGGLQIGLRAWDAGAPAAAHGAVGATFDARPSAPALLALTAVDGGPLPLPGRGALERRLAATVTAWRAWLNDTTYDGRWSGAVRRSLLALKLLADPESGCLVAAGTTSLPEAIGGERNFDYRFGWVRDCAFAVDALLRMGMHEAAHTALTWLLGAAGHTHPRLNPVYHLDGTPLKGQQALDLAGYRASTPVHVGNQAGSQRQLGSWGDFLETVYLYSRDGHVLPPEIGARLADCADLVERIWQRDDAGLWEIDDADYTTSKMSCWLVFDRVLRLAADGQVPARHTGRWERAREDIRRHVETRLWSDSKRSYVMKSGSDMLDCGTLLASRRGFCDPRGERMNATIDALRSELGAGGPLLYRYSGMQEQENAFLACSFWMVEALARAHRLDEAAETMDALVGLATGVGLYAEEMDPGEKLMRGNLPQALTHLSLLNAAALFAEAEREVAAA